MRSNQLSFVLFLIVWGQTKSFQMDTNTKCTSRRAFVVASSFAGSSLLPGDTTAKALEAPVTSGSPLMPGGAASYRPVVDGEWSNFPELRTKLGKSRVRATELSPLQQPPFAGLELYYAPFLFGSWNATATLKRKIYPYGTAFVPSNSLIEGSPRNLEEQVGNSCSYEVHYFSTLANTLANQITVNLGTGVPESKIIQDRAFNAISISKAYQQLAPVQDVDWDYRDNPTKLTLNFGTGVVAQDMRPLGPRRTEIYLTARAAEAGMQDNGEAETVYCTAERSRSVTLAPGAAIVSDTETITEFTKVTNNQVHAVSRIVVYLTPNPNSREGVLWQQVGGHAVAFFDYDIDMQRILTDFTVGGDDSSLRNEKRACVTTPKDIIQCE